MKKLNKRALLVAGPTCGKSTIIRSLRTKGISCLDTDEVCSEFVPEWDDQKLWLNPEYPVNQLVFRLKDFVVGVMTLRSNPISVVSNLWGPTFLTEVLPPVVGGKLGWLYVVRADALEITELSKTRTGSVIPTALAAKWLLRAERDAHNRFEHVIWLPKDIHLSMVVEFTKQGWDLTALGLLLVDKGRNFSLSYKGPDVSGVEKGATDAK